MASQPHFQTDDEASNLTSFEVNFQDDADDAADKHGGGGLLRPSRMCHLAVLSTSFWAFVLFLHYSSTQGGGGGVASALFKQSAFSLPPLLSGSTVGRGRTPPAQPPPDPATQGGRSVTAAGDRCAGRYIYMYDLPPRFNDDLVRDCKKLWRFYDMCPLLANFGMGRLLGDEGGVFAPRGWYVTNQFTLDLIFHARMKRYECLTDDPSLAAAVYVPFYASLDGGRHMWNSTSLRDMLGLDLVEWLAQRPQWRAMGGRDHFMVAGRIAWDFRRYEDVDEHWGTRLLNFPAVQNMTVLVLETNPWGGTNLAVPYPTYFHPETAADVAAWQEKVRKLERTWLFSFAGSNHPWAPNTVRPQIFEQCGASSRCKLFRCDSGRSANNCKVPSAVMRVFESSAFCLQPRGDSLTRRSTFDAILAGCIPVFFHPGSAHTQYTLHLPRDDPNRWSVLIMHTDVTERNVSIEETLTKIPPETVKTMREEVIRLIPRVVYADPRSRRIDFKDAFDVAVEAVIDRVARRRRGDVEAR
ncbi:Xyloglucan galactosyltransferase KATAMARI1-like protein [Dichanthelium oligosanthes]|uniref:Xyloglucan galactosyltransferase KATAMARI1-like protein n=1 Tax=Dichanthelium oligosanthes TaxID=888268 RepID=A0A1E5V1H2_9POAL|nr:Xyloglucan galactosyltransferase KATAMARI1-like protein [Dichanthelium oligosanthes]